MKIVLFILFFIFSTISQSAEYLLVKNGKVQNRILADSNFADSIKSQFEAVILIDSSNTEVDIGYAYDGTKFTAPPKTIEEIAEDQRVALQKLKAGTIASDLQDIKTACAADIGTLKLMCDHITRDIP